MLFKYINFSVLAGKVKSNIQPGLSKELQFTANPSDLTTFFSTKAASKISNRWCSMRRYLHVISLSH